jgi:DNA-binding LacI/PurR family transcriptional regulator
LSFKEEGGIVATQVDIAAALGIDTSSVNKILNKVRGSVFRPETIKRVFAKAKELGYKQSGASKGQMRRTLEELFPSAQTNISLAVLRGLAPAEVARIKRMLYGEPDFKL